MGPLPAEKKEQSKRAKVSPRASTPRAAQKLEVLPHAAFGAEDLEPAGGGGAPRPTARQPFRVCNRCGCYEPFAGATDECCFTRYGEHCQFDAASSTSGVPGLGLSIFIQGGDESPGQGRDGGTAGLEKGVKEARSC